LPFLRVCLVCWVRVDNFRVSPFRFFGASLWVNRENCGEAVDVPSKFQSVAFIGSDCTTRHKYRGTTTTMRGRLYLTPEPCHKRTQHPQDLIIPTQEMLCTLIQFEQSDNGIMSNKAIKARDISCDKKDVAAQHHSLTISLIYHPEFGQDVQPRSGT